MADRTACPPEGRPAQKVSLDQEQQKWEVVGGLGIVGLPCVFVLVFPP
jgi:hypothetical protein